MVILKEEGIRLSVPKTVFFNPHMRFCRSFSSLFIGALDAELCVLDGMSACGARGLRYACENSNVKKITFLDLNKKAVKATKANVKKNKKSFKARARVINSDVNLFMHEHSGKFNFIELDPFGSPLPFLYDAIRCLSKLKRSFLSVTATDTAVLCGANSKACVKNYSSKPLNNEFTHENGVRILLASIARIASFFNFSTTPLLSLSKRHYFKLFICFEQGADAAVESAKKANGFVFYCSKCLHRFPSFHPLATSSCSCGAPLDFGGPLWLGELFDEQILKRMLELNEERNYADKKELASVLSLMLEEARLPSFYFDLHKIFKNYSLPPKKTQAILDALRAEGFTASRTHFIPTGIRTDAGIKKIREAIKSSSGV
ncbi:tRNA (guanine(10)-N(2))-dimethyltransferase [Candidatus Micrarchaeota archaeon]|nr:tRNA (guanine(10)-N(2))-dimethyltransferase [Candidatus Micrarchaeota archaeon]